MSGGSNPCQCIVASSVGHFLEIIFVVGLVRLVDQYL